MSRLGLHFIPGIFLVLIGITLLVLSVVDTYAYPHGERYQTDIVVETDDGNRAGFLWKEDLSNLDVPGWVKWNRDTGDPMFMSGFIAIFAGGIVVVWTKRHYANLSPSAFR